MKRAKPQYMCTYRQGCTTVTKKAHERGPLLSRSGDVMVFGCGKCGVIFWEESPVLLGDPGQCQGVTVEGKRCRLASEEGSLFCGHHLSQVGTKSVLP